MSIHLISFTDFYQPSIPRSHSAPTLRRASPLASPPTMYLSKADTHTHPSYTALHTLFLGSLAGRIYYRVHPLSHALQLLTTQPLRLVRLQSHILSKMELLWPRNLVISMELLLSLSTLPIQASMQHRPKNQMTQLYYY